MSYGIKTWYNGIEYDSKTEAAYAQHLDILLKKKKIKWWKRQVIFSVEDASGEQYRIVPDFLVMPSTREEIHEVKNKLYTPKFLYKYQLFLEQYPSIRCFIVEPDANGNWIKTPLAEFIKPYLVTQPTAQKVYPKWQIKLSEWFYRLASKIV